MPTAATRTRSWPGPVCGTGRSRSSSVSGPPATALTQAFMRPALPRPVPPIREDNPV